MKHRGLFLCWFALSTAPILADTYEIGSFRIYSGPTSLQVSSTLSDERIIWERSANSDWLQFSNTTWTMEGEQGRFDVKSSVKARCSISPNWESIETGPGQLRMLGRLTGKSPCAGVSFILNWQAVNTQRLALTITSSDPQFNLIELKLASTSDEGFYGFGLQPTFLDLKGQNVPIISQEQGVTRGRQPFSALVNSQEKGAAGTTLTSYMAAPQFITNRNRGLFLENSEYSEIDMRDKTSTTVRLFSARMKAQILAGSSPLDLIEAYTEYAGRMQALPDWFHQGAVIGMQGGTQRVRDVWQQLAARQTPLAGFWLQDWQGKRTTSFGSQLWWNWELDRQLYSGWDTLLADFKSKGIRVLGYINPHLVDVAGQGKLSFDRNLFAEAQNQGFLIKNAKGEDYSLKLTAFASGMLDLTQPGAQAWMKRVIQDELLAQGFSGWMCDFSEAYPFDASNAAGLDAKTYHNQYVIDWARINREAIEEAGRNDVVFFCRAGFSQSPAQARLFWQGDQMVTWDANDGLKSAVTGLIGGGVSGFSLNHSDIGGYTTLAKFGIGLKREKELLLRWMEVNAFTSAFRSHEGNLPDENAQIYSDSETLDAFARQAKIFSSLFFYRKQLFQQAQDKGYPVVRGLFMHYPEDAKSWHIDDQFLLGRDILVAPIVEKGQKKRNVYLPAGRWVHIWSGEVYGSLTTGTSISIQAPLGQIPAFYAEGSLTGAEWKRNLQEAGIIR